MVAVAAADVAVFTAAVTTAVFRLANQPILVVVGVRLPSPSLFAAVVGVPCWRVALSAVPRAFVSLLLLILRCCYL